MRYLHRLSLIKSQNQATATGSCRPTVPVGCYYLKYDRFGLQILIYLYAKNITKTGLTLIAYSRLYYSYNVTDKFVELESLAKAES